MQGEPNIVEASTDREKEESFRVKTTEKEVSQTEKEVSPINLEEGKAQAVEKKLAQPEKYKMKSVVFMVNRTKSDNSQAEKQSKYP